MSKVVLVTGASRGIGHATTLEFAKRGAGWVLGSRCEETGAALLKDPGDVPPRPRTSRERSHGFASDEASFVSGAVLPVSGGRAAAGTRARVFPRIKVQ